MRKLIIVVAVINGIGHINACAGALSQLLARGHRVIFVVSEEFDGKLKALGYEEYLITSKKEQLANGNKIANKDIPGKALALFFEKHKILGNGTPLEKLVNLSKLSDNPAKREATLRNNSAIKEAIQLYKPDLIYQDGNFFPSVFHTDIPWIQHISVAPLYACDRKGHPPGLPSDDPSEWAQFNEIRQKLLGLQWVNIDMKNMGMEPFGPEITRKQLETQVMTVYAYPEELNFEIFRQEGWLNLEVFNKTSFNDRVKLDTLVPEHFLSNTLEGKFTGKLIYVSLGTIGSVNLDLMNRLIAILGKTHHKYIVSKGPRSDELQLAENMWGDRYLSQTMIVPHVDLVITHGGNNTVTETFAEGKPMIVLPLCSDGFDNAQRLKETGLGARIDPYNFAESDLFNTIEQMLNDEHLKDKLQTAAKRIQHSDKHKELAIKIEQLIQ